MSTTMLQVMGDDDLSEFDDELFAPVEEQMSSERAGQLLGCELENDDGLIE